MEKIVQEKLEELIHEEKTKKYIAQYFNIDTRVLSRYLTKYNIQFHKVRQITEISKEQLELEIEKGKTYTELLSIFNIGTSSLTYRLKKYNLKIKETQKKNIENCTNKTCPKCNINKPVSDFFVRRGNNTSSYCKKCCTDIRNNKGTKNKNDICELKGNKCHICELKCKNNIQVFELHHKDPSKKEYALSSSGNRYISDIEKIMPEIDKTILVCVNCHREIHGGLHPEYLESEVVRHKPEIKDKVPETKICNCCTQSKSLSDFYQKRNGQGVSHGWCIECMRNQSALRKRQFKQKCLDFLGNKCEECGYCIYNGALEFHHKDPKEKDFNLSKVGCTNLNEKIKSELRKCKLLCANCHRIEHTKINTENLTQQLDNLTI